MENQEDKSILNNASVKRNPITTIMGIIVIIAAAFMLAGLYILPMFVDLKKEASYDWYHVLAVFCVGVVLIYFNDDYFKQLFGIGKLFLKKKAGVEDSKSE